MYDTHIPRSRYGGNGPEASEQNNTNQPNMNEPGFIGVPPCVWGESGDYNGQLKPPPGLGGVQMKIAKRCNATFGHHGEMAHGQVYYDASL